MLGRSTVRMVIGIAAGRRRLTTSLPLPKSILGRIAVSSQIFNQKRYGQVEVFGPHEPPKQLTFKEVESRVLKAIRAWDRFPADKESLLKIEADFVKDLGFDSLDQACLITPIWGYIMNCLIEPKGMFGVFTKAGLSKQIGDLTIRPPIKNTVEIMMAVEDEFGFEIPLEDSEKLKSPRDVYKYICEREDVYE